MYNKTNIIKKGEQFAMTVSMFVVIIILLLIAFLPCIIRLTCKLHKNHLLKKMTKLLTSNGDISIEELIKYILHLHHNKKLKWTHGEIYKYCYCQYIATYKNLNISIYRYTAYEDYNIKYEITLHSDEDILSSHDITFTIPHTPIDIDLYEAITFLYQDIEYQLKEKQFNNKNTNNMNSKESIEKHYNILKHLIK